MCLDPNSLSGPIGLLQHHVDHYRGSSFDNGCQCFFALVDCSGNDAIPSGAASLATLASRLGDSPQRGFAVVIELEAGRHLFCLAILS